MVVSRVLANLDVNIFCLYSGIFLVLSKWNVNNITANDDGSFPGFCIGTAKYF